MCTEIVCDLVYKRPFVYEIGGKHYFIGRSVFRECKQEEVELYGHYREAFQRQSRVCKYEVGADAAELADSVRTLVKIGDSEYDSQNEDGARAKLYGLLQSQSEVALDALDGQIGDFTAALDLVDHYHIKYE